MTAREFDHEAWDRMASAPLLNQGPPSTTGGLTLADLEAAAAALPDTSGDPVAFRAHPASIDALRRRLAPLEARPYPHGASAVTTNPFCGLRVHPDLELEPGAFVPMTAKQERAWLDRRRWAEAIRGMARLAPAVRTTARWLNKLQEELVHVVEAAGLLFTAGKRSRHRQRERNRARLHASQAHRSRRSRRRPGGKWARA